MEITTIELKEVVVVKDVLCNKCGLSLFNNYNHEGLVEADFTGGYASKLGDMNRYRFSICEACLIALFDTFKIDPLVHTMDGTPPHHDPYRRECAWRVYGRQCDCVVDHCCETCHDTRQCTKAKCIEEDSAWVNSKGLG